MVGIELMCGDGREVLHRMAREAGGAIEGHIITDPPYDMLQTGMLFWVMRAACSGTVIMFSFPGQAPRLLDEYHHWIKPESTKNYTRSCGRFVETISIKHGNQRVFNAAGMHWSQLTGVHRDRLIHTPLHPWEKPLSLMMRLVALYTNPGDLVVDPFGGCGTTALACRKLGRRCVSIEQSGQVHATALARLGGKVGRVE